MEFRVIDAPRARRDLRNIKRYISFDSPQAAEKFGRFLLSKARMLGQHPWMGRVVPDFRNPNIREIIVGNYRVIYRVDSLAQQIEIVRYWHGARGTPEI